MPKFRWGLLLCAFGLLVTAKAQADDFSTNRRPVGIDKAKGMQGDCRSIQGSRTQFACEMEPRFTTDGKLILCTGNGFLIEKTPKVRNLVLDTMTQTGSMPLGQDHDTFRTTLCGCEVEPRFTPEGELILCTGNGFIILKKPSPRLSALEPAIFDWIEGKRR